MSKLRSNIWLCATIVFAVALVTFSFYHIVTRPGHIITELGGDAAKNALTYLYQSQWGTGYWFEGMNYPYGEHIVYTDGQPLLSVLLTHFHNVTPGVALTVMWWLISLSYVLAVVFIYRILLRFRVAPLAAMLFAGLIAIFTPQIMRLQGHYALSYTCVIPMLFYWTIKYRDQPHWRFPLYFLVTGCVMSFLHPYYAAMMLVWVFSYSLGYFMFTKARWSAKLRHVAPLVVSVVMVLIVVGSVMKSTDPVTDRPAAPFNAFYETCTRVKHVITSAQSPVWQMAKHTSFFSRLSTGDEGYSYIGLVVAITLGISLVAAIFVSLRKRSVDIPASDTGFSPIWLAMAFLALLVGMGAPFIWHMEWLFDYVSFFRQFRSMGRFSWMFYYIVAVYAVVVLYSVFAKYALRKKYIPAYGLMLLSFGLWSYEASGYIKHTRFLSWLGIYDYDVIFSNDGNTWAKFLDTNHRSSSDFQAVLMLPFFHVGTEKLWVGEPNWMISLGARASLQLHLPMVDVMMSRSSWSQAMKQVKTVGGPLTDKPMLRDIKSRKPFLLMAFEDYMLNPDQAYLLRASDYIGHFMQCQVYACYPDRIVANDKAYADSIAALLPSLTSADTVIGNNGIFYSDHYDKGGAGDAFFGAGSILPAKNSDSIIATLPVTIVPRDSQLYELSCWFLLSSKDYKSPYIWVDMLNDSGRVVGRIDALTRQSTDNHGMWFRAGVYFYVKSNYKAIRLKLINIPYPACLAMDELQLRSADALVVSKDAGGNVLVNNHLFKKGN